VAIASEVVEVCADLGCAGVIAEVFEDGLGLLPYVRRHFGPAGVAVDAA
jgi:hypothetical protein